MKKTILILSIFNILTINASEYLITLDDKHYESSILVKDYIAPIVQDSPVVQDFYSNDISHFTLSNGTTNSGNITTGGYIVPVNNGSFANGYTYYEFNATHHSFTGISSTLTFDSANSWLWYGYNQNFYYNSAYQGVVGTYGISNRISFLIKQPEGKLWIAKDGVWMNGTDPEINSVATQQLTPNQQYFPAAATGTGAGSSTNFHFKYEEWLHYDSLMSWLD